MPMPLLTEFGKTARKYRIDHGLKLKDMARMVGASSATLSGVETGKKPLPDAWIPRLPEPLRAPAARAAIQYRIERHRAAIAEHESAIAELEKSLI